MKVLLRILVCLAAAGALACPERAADDGEPEVPLVPPQRSEVKPIESAQPAELSAESVEEFLAWAAGAGRDKRSEVREAIHRARGNPDVVDPLFERFEASYTQDVALSLVILGILGELQSPAVAAGLHEVAWRSLPEPREVPHGGLSERDLVEMIQAKAVEGLAYARTQEADRMVLEVVAEHPSIAVRSAAVDAYLYNHDDSESAKKQLGQLLRPDEAYLLERTRRSASLSRREFDERIARFYETYPDQVAPEPEPPAGVADQLAPPDRAGQPTLPVQPRKDDGR